MGEDLCAQEEVEELQGYGEVGEGNEEVAEGKGGEGGG